MAIFRRQSRRCLRRYGYLVTGSQTEKVFALLIESGAAYCVIWVRSLSPAGVVIGTERNSTGCIQGLIVAYEIIQYRW